MLQPVRITIAGRFSAHADLAGRILASCTNRAGWHVFGLPQQDGISDYSDISLNISHTPVNCLSENIDLLACFDASAWERHVGMLSPCAIVLADSDISIALPRRKKLRVIRLPIARLAREIGGHPRTRVSVVAAAIAALAEIPFIDLQSAMESAISPAEILGHTRAARAAYQAIGEQTGRLAMPASPTRQGRILISGAQAVGIGAIAGGATFVASVQQSDSIHNIFQEYCNDFSIVFQHVDGIDQAVGQATGAAIAGSRALVVSEGPIELIANGFRAAAISETPLVILQCTHASESPAPAQEELSSALAMGGDVPHIVLAPASIEELFGLIQESFNVAELLQTPIIVLCDQQLLHSWQSAPDLAAMKATIQRGQLMSAKQARAISGYLRYQITNDGISLRKLPGQPGDLFTVSTLPHQDNGMSGSVTDYAKQSEKRLRKVKVLSGSGLPYKMHGSAEAEVTLVCYGSSTGAAIQAGQMLNQSDIATNVLQIVALAPFPSAQIHQIFRGSKHLLLIEADATAQLGGLIRHKTGIDLHHRLLTTGGEQIYPEKIVRAVQKAFTHA